jgi:hypothetical protein
MLSTWRSMSLSGSVRALKIDRSASISTCLGKRSCSRGCQMLVSLDVFVKESHGSENTAEQ